VTYPVAANLDLRQPICRELYEHLLICAIISVPCARPIGTMQETHCHELYDTYFAWLPERGAVWRRTLASMLPPARRGADKTTGTVAEDRRLTLATSLFRCKICSYMGLLAGNDAAGHDCWSRPDSLRYVDRDLPGVIGAEPWNHYSQLVFDQEASDLAATVARVYGLDPATASVSDFAPHCHHILCRLCKTTRRWKWLNAVSAHIANVHAQRQILIYFEG
jgi:hypothetical protein